MQKIPLSKLQELSNMLYEEPNVSLRNSMSAWIESTNTNNEHTAISSIAAMAQQSVIKDKILTWVDKVLNPDKPYVYIPDVPAQMEEKTNENNITEEPERIPEEVVFEIPVEIKEKKVRKKKD